MLEAPARSAYIFFLPTSTPPDFGEEVARRVCVAATGLGFTTDVERAAFALGGAQAVADLILGEQRERQSAQGILPA
jgi:histidinol dehydrogenase